MGSHITTIITAMAKTLAELIVFLDSLQERAPLPQLVAELQELEIGCEGLICSGWVTLEGPRNRSDRGRVVAHRGTELRKLTDVDRVVMICLSRHRCHELRQRREP